MAEQGLTSLFPTDELSIIGLVAIPRRLPMIFRRSARPPKLCLQRSLTRW
jgi:lipid A disaccharide synthetase